QEFEQRTAALLQSAGFIVSQPSLRREQGADFAVWIDDIDEALGNPLLVEVKAGDISLRRLHDAAANLRRYVAKTHGRCALLVYWDEANRKYPEVSLEWPLIF